MSWGFYAIDGEEFLHAGKADDSGVEGGKTVGELLLKGDLRGYGGEGRVQGGYTALKGQETGSRGWIC